MEKIISKDSIIQNLIAIDYDPNQIQTIIDYIFTNKINSSLVLLYQYRKELLDKVHEEQIKLDRLDYLLHLLKSKEVMIK